jgi:hypothetical protein
MESVQYCTHTISGSIDHRILESSWHAADALADP